MNINSNLYAPFMPVSPATTNSEGIWNWLRDLTGGSKPWRFCPHCGEALEQAAAPFWSASPLHTTNEARVMEAESEGDD